MTYVGSIDQGTSSTRFIIFDKQGQIVASHQKEHKQYFPKTGWVEHDAIEIWDNTVECINGALEKSKLKASDLASVGITNQRETVVVWNKAGKPFYNAIVWQDMRSEAICHALKKDGGVDRFRERTGLPVVPYFSGTKMKWLLDHIPDIAAAAKEGDVFFGTIDTWLLWKLSEGTSYITDVTNASRTLLMNINTLKWDDTQCEILGISQKMLPTIVSSSQVYFKATAAVLKDVPIAGILGDQQAALFGQTCFDIGEAKNTYGTGCFLLLNTGEKVVQSKFGLLTTVGYQIGNEKAVYALEGSVAIGGAVIQWLRDNFNLISDASEVEALALSVEDTGGIYFVPAFSGLYAPYWRDDARGAIVGLTRMINKGHLARASLESTAYQSLDVFKAMEEDAGVKLSSLRVDGGMIANNTLMQFQSDILDIEVVRPEIAETTALGAAYAAGLAVGVWKNMKELKTQWKSKKHWTSAMDEVKRNKLIKGWKKAVKKTFDWVDEEDEVDLDHS